MAEENLPRSVPESGHESPVDSSPGDPSSGDASPLTDRGRTPRVRRATERRRNILIVAAVFVVVIGGLFLWRYLSSYESTDDAQVDVHLYPVSARVSGYVVRVNVNDNQWWRKVRCWSRSTRRTMKFRSRRRRRISPMPRQP